MLSSQNLKIPVALNEQGSFVEPSLAIMGERYFCPQCRKQLMLKHGSIRQKHFSHPPSENICDIDLITHKWAIHLLQDRLEQTIQKLKPAPAIILTCSSCGTRISRPIQLGGATHIVPEYPIEDFRVDLMVMMGDMPKFAVEIFNTHKVQDNKREKLGCWYIEIEASAIIENPNVLDVLTSNKSFHCPECHAEIHAKIDESAQYIFGLLRRFNYECIIHIQDDGVFIKIPTETMKRIKKLLPLPRTANR